MIYDIQKASLLKRIPAWILDSILTLIVAVGVMTAFSFLLQVDKHTQALNDVYAAYEQKYEIDFSLSQEEISRLDEEQLALYQAATEELAKDTVAQKAYEQVLTSMFFMVSLGLFTTALVLDFLIPLWLKNGQTLGKKMFGIALVRYDSVRVTPMMVFVRGVLGKYTLETMIPVLLVMMLMFGAMGLTGAVTLLVVLALVFILPLITKNRSAIHDLLACTVAVDLSTQMIFDTPEAREAYQKKIDEEMASRTED